MEKYENPGNGTILVLQSTGGILPDEWEVVTTIQLPSNSASFDDYAGLDVTSDGTIAVVSQQDAKLWLGQLDFDTWTIVGDEDAGTTYTFPKENGSVVFCNVEGVSFLESNRIVISTDSDDKSPCDTYAESVATFTIP